MSTITFDTLRYTKKLREAGYTEQQAEGAAEAQKDILNEVLDTTLATKNDLKELEANIVKWIAAIMIGQTALIVTLIKLLK
jgi:hypothetical protein